MTPSWRIQTGHNPAQPGQQATRKKESIPMKAVKFLGALAITAGLMAFAAAPAFADEHGGLTKQLQQKVAELSTEQQAALYLLLSQLAAGDAAKPAEAAASPEEIITEGIKNFFNAAKEGDDETMLSFFSEDFRHFMFGDREGLKGYLNDARGMGYLEGIEVDLSYAEFKEEDGKITVYPVDVQGSFGLITFEYVLRPEDGTWRVIELDVEGL